MTTPLPMAESEPLAGDSPLEKTLAYHERTKHQPDRYAAGPGYLDWDSQPNPFRRFRGAAMTPLPLTADAIATPYEDLYRPGSVPSSPLDLQSLGAFFELSLGLSAWKSAGASRWALRMNPSSGNLHPTEGYAHARGIPGVPDGVHHYAPLEHALEHRAAANLPLPDGSFLVGLSSIFWREAWKYGERAFRYCNHDVGHAIAALWFAGAALGWSVSLLDDPGDADIASVLGLDRTGDFASAEREHPDALLLVRTRMDTEGPVLDALLAALEGAEWHGAANRLSDTRREWPVIEEVAAATAKPRTMVTPIPERAPAEAGGVAMEASAVSIIRRRRSAQAFDGETGLTRAAFLRMMDRTADRQGTPFEALSWEPMIHPVHMVHRVADVSPGLHAQPRAPEAGDRLRASMQPDFAWEIEDTGIAAPRLLVEGDGRSAARAICCHQDIASDGMFSTGMLADYRATLAGRGPWWYRRMFWEAGVLGQILYLEAEAMGVRGTGIGCYFDDAFHDILGLEGDGFQSMYHFTVGMPLEDLRLQTHPPYAHIRRPERQGEHDGTTDNRG